MLKIAITGNIASGKSTAEDFLKEKGFKVLDTDNVSHDLLKDENVKNQILKAFCNFDILEDAQISRQKLGQIIFGNKQRRTKLEAILHPLVKEEIKRFFHQQYKNGEKIAFVSVPLLFEAKFEDLFDKIILVYADDKLRLERLIKRNKIPLEYAKNRLNIQSNQDEKVSLSDYVLYNNKNLDDLNQNIEKLIIYFKN